MSFSSELQPVDFSMSSVNDTDIELINIDETKLTYLDFEEVISYQDTRCPIRQCRSMDISVEDYKRVMETPGEFCILNVYGGGPYTQWYFYHTLAGEYVFIFRTFNSYDESFKLTWKYGSPSGPGLQRN
jgi:hypothetical protein